MNKKGVLLAIVITALLAAAAWWISRPARPGPVAAPGPILPGIDPAEVKSLVIRWRNGDEVRVSKSASADSWMLHDGRGGAEVRWPVEAEVARGAARLLCSAEGQEAAGASVGDGGPAVEMEFGSGRKVEARFAADALAGRCAVRVLRADGTSGVFLVAESVARLFESRAVRSWRSRRVLPVDGPASRIAISGQGGACGLSRAGGAWGVIEPALGRADEQAVAELLSRLAAVELDRFAEGEAPGETGLGESSPRISVESDRRAIEGEDVARRMVAQHIRIGGRADLSAKTVFVEVGGTEIDVRTGTELSSWGPVIGVADATKLAAISADPLAYIDRRTCDVPAADIVGLSFSVAGPGETADPVTVMSRSAEGWVWSLSGQPPRPVAIEDVRQLEALLRLLCEERSQRVLKAEPQAAHGVCIEVAQRGRPPRTVRLRSTGPGDDPAAWLGITSDGLERRYPLAGWTTVRSWAEDRVRPPR
ncbi:MAG: hypothetical protein IT436_05005 [Phycisphaerales bacterium]|nr:hypothetical protein [Phycisphaerales bacterium]